MNGKILIVEDEEKLREVLCDYFRSKGDVPIEAENGVQALELLDENELTLPCRMSFPCRRTSILQGNSYWTIS